MDLQDRHVVVTGGASGIGRALCERFAAGGARVVVADLQADAAREVAKSVGGLGLACDVRDESQLCALVAGAEAHFGPVDMFCSNAGVSVLDGEHAAATPDQDWTLCWEVHVMAHVYAARAVLPSMLARKEGYLLQTVSAAGLLNQPGATAYSATKHAALGFAEALAITHGGDGIKVSAICPMLVATPMAGLAELDENAAAIGAISPEQVAEAAFQGVRDETFLILPHPEVQKFRERKAADCDRWLAGMRRMRTTMPPSWPTPPSERVVSQPRQAHPPLGNSPA